MDIVLDDNDGDDNDMKEMIVLLCVIVIENSPETLKMNFVNDNNLRLLAESDPSTMTPATSQDTPTANVILQAADAMLVLIATLSLVLHPLTCILPVLNQVPHTHSLKAMKPINNSKKGETENENDSCDDEPSVTHRGGIGRVRVETVRVEDDV